MCPNNSVTTGKRNSRVTRGVRQQKKYYFNWQSREHSIILTFVEKTNTKNKTSTYDFNFNIKVSRFNKDSKNQNDKNL